MFKKRFLKNLKNKDWRSANPIMCVDDMHLCVTPIISAHFYFKNGFEYQDCVNYSEENKQSAELIKKRALENIISEHEYPIVFGEMTYRLSELSAFRISIPKIKEEH